MTKTIKDLVLPIICLIIVAITIIAGINFRNDQSDIDGILLVTNSEEVNISCEKLKEKEFSGELLNGKGEKSIHDYEGVSFYDLCKNNKITPEDINHIEVTSADQYTVSVTGDEICEDGRVYLAVYQDGTAIEGIEDGTNGVQLVVFGDSNSKRCVRYVKEIKIQ
jgi:hypothetical protein